MAEAAAKHGYSSSVHSNDGGSNLSVPCSIDVMATPAGVLERQSELTWLFRSYKAACDSWGTAGNGS